MKKISYVLFALLLFIIFKVSASAGSLSIWSNVTSVKVGQTVTISVKADNLAGLFNITSSNNNILSGGSSDAWLENDTYSFTFTAKSVGTATITAAATIRSSDPNDEHGVVAFDDENNYFTGSKSVTVTVVNPPSNSSGGSSSGSSGGSSSSGSGGNSSSGATADKKNYSSNNYLKSLEVEKYSISPAFSKDILEYKLEVSNDVTKVNIKAGAEDSKATVNGAGEVSLTEGLNKIEVKVIAENGNEKKYIINITVKELNPIEVTIDKKKYTIVRKDNNLTIPENYEKSSVKIGKDSVLCFKNKITGNILIALKDEKGNINFYSYDKKNNKYTLYNAHKFGNLILNILDMPKKELPSDYSKTSFTYDGSKITGYQYIQKNVTYAADSKVKGNDFYLVYAINEMTGEKGLYIYDKLENTIQRYNNNLFLAYEHEANKYFFCFLITIAITALTIITSAIILMKKKSHKNKFA